MRPHEPSARAIPAATETGAVPSDLLARARAMRRLDDPGLIERARAMTVAERLESGFELCRFGSALAAATR